MQGDTLIVNHESIVGSYIGQEGIDIMTIIYNAAKNYPSARVMILRLHLDKSRLKDKYGNALSGDIIINEKTISQIDEIRKYHTFKDFYNGTYNDPLNSPISPFDIESALATPPYGQFFK